MFHPYSKLPEDARTPENHSFFFCRSVSFRSNEKFTHRKRFEIHCILFSEKCNFSFKSLVPSASLLRGAASTNLLLLSVMTSWFVRNVRSIMIGLYLISGECLQTSSDRSKKKRKLDTTYCCLLPKMVLNYVFDKQKPEGWGQFAKIHGKKGSSPYITQGTGHQKAYNYRKSFSYGSSLLPSFRGRSRDV